MLIYKTRREKSLLVLFFLKVLNSYFLGGLLSLPLPDLFPVLLGHPPLPLLIVSPPLIKYINNLF